MVTEFENLGNLWNQLINESPDLWARRREIYCQRCGGLGLVAAGCVLHPVADDGTANGEDVCDRICPECQGDGVQPHVRAVLRPAPTKDVERSNAATGTGWMVATPRRARKRHECRQYQEHRRLAAIRDDVAPCRRFGGVIEIGELYFETEGVDPFHPFRYHQGCLPEGFTTVEGPTPANITIGDVLAVAEAIT